MSPIPLDIREVDIHSCLSVINEDPKNDPKFGFLHIPKTGGTSIVDFLSHSSSTILKHPVLLFHSWDVPLIREYFPEMKLLTLIRDPLERTISGFQSRLRMGRPRYYQPWRPFEASAFAIYKTIESFLDALLEDDDYSICSTTYALDNILAISWNLQHYFKSKAYAKECRTSFEFIGRTESMDVFVEKILSKCILFDSPESLANAKKLYQPAHVSGKPSTNILSRYLPTDIEKLRERLGVEYEIYNELVK